MNKGGAFLTTPFGVDEIFTREKWSDDQKEPPVAPADGAL